MRAPSVPSSLPGRQPRTTASIVRTRLILTIPTRSPGRYGASSCFAMTPSSPCSLGTVERRRREVDRPLDEVLQPRPPVALGQLEQELVVDRQDVEGDEACRR